MEAGSNAEKSKNKSISLHQGSSSIYCVATAGTRTLRIRQMFVHSSTTLCFAAARPRSGAYVDVYALTNKGVKQLRFLTIP